MSGTVKFRTFQEISRGRYGTELDIGASVSLQRIDTGTLLRIAEALERIDSSLQQFTPDGRRRRLREHQERLKQNDEDRIYERASAAAVAMPVVLPTGISHRLAARWFVAGNPNGDPSRPEDWMKVVEKAKSIRYMGKMKAQMLRTWAEECAAKISSSAADGGDTGANTNAAQ